MTKLRPITLARLSFGSTGPVLPRKTAKESELAAAMDAAGMAREGRRRAGLAGHALASPEHGQAGRCARCGADLFLESHQLSPSLIAALRANGAIVADDRDRPGWQVYASGAAMLPCEGVSVRET